MTPRNDAGFLRPSLDVFHRTPLGSHHDGGTQISKTTSKSVDFDRLECAIRALAGSHAELRKENAGLRSALSEGGQRIRALDSELIAANQRRQDAYKRIDELIAHLDQLDAQLVEAGE